MELLGNEQALRRLEQSIASGRIGHGYLFTGAEGTGKRTLARWFAKAILCTGEHPPCGECPACRKMERLSHPDYKEYAGENRARSFPVETVRQIRQDCAILPNEGKKKIYCLSNVQNMTMEGMNAFLKTLEEPPAHSVFLLLCPSATQLPETVRSRLVQIALQPLSTGQVEQILAQKLPESDAALRRQAALLSDGSAGLAMKLVQEPEFGQRAKLAQTICQSLIRRREYELAQALAGLEKDGEGFLQVLQLTQGLLRIQLEQPASPLPQKQEIRVLELLEQARLRLSGNAHKGLTGAWLAIRMMEAVSMP